MTVRVDPGLERVARAAARRLQRSGLQARGRLTLDGVTDAEIAALSGLLGRRWRAPSPGARVSVDLAALDDALRASRHACTLVDLATAAHGAPLVDAVAARAGAQAARAAGWEALRRHPAVMCEPALGGWLDRERATGAAVRSADADPFALLTAALDLVGALPAAPPMSLARLAAERCGGDPHALDRGRPLDSVVQRALGHLDGEDPLSPGAGARRERYDRWGVACDELSATVLTLGLRPSGDAPLARRLRAAADVGEPAVLTLRELRDVDRLDEVGPRVFTCENPDVVAAAADALGPACRPLVCTEGWPSTACLGLLRALVAGGAACAHHGDMDRDGLRIVDHLLAATGGEPWRMTAADHDVHAASGAASPDSAPIAARDPRLQGLADAIAATGRLVREEQAIVALLADLAAGSSA